MNYKILLCVVGLLVPAITAVEKCYECEYFDLHPSNATNNEKCKDSPPPEEYLRNCSESMEADQQPEHWQCLLVRGRIEVDEENYNIVKRACVPGKTFETTCKDTKAYQTSHGSIKRGSECICDDKDGCNTGAGITFGIVTLGLSLVLSQL